MKTLPASPALRFAAGVGVMRIGGLGLEFAAWVILARRLDLHEFGVLSVAFVVARYSGLIGDWGATYSGARDLVIEPKSVGPLLRHRQLVTGAVTAVFSLATLGLGYGALAVLGVVVLSRGLNRDWIAIARNQPVRAGAPALAQGLSLLLLAIVFGNTGSHGAVVVATAYGVALAMSLALNRLGGGDGKRPTVTWALVLSLASQIILFADTTLLALMRDATEAAIYAAVYRIPTAVLTTTGLLAAGLAGAAARSLIQSTEYQAKTLRRARIGGLVGAACVIALIVPAVMAVVPLLGDRYADGRLPMVLLMVGVAVTVSAAALFPVAMAKGADRQIAIAAIWAAVLALVGNILLIPPYGMTGAAATALLAQSLVAGAIWRYSAEIK